MEVNMKIAMLIVLLISTIGCAPFKGSDGATGATGAKGETGATGASGADGLTLSSQSFCSKSQTVNSVSMTFQYDIYTFSDGTKMIRCAVGDGFTNYDTHFMWKSNQAGASQEGCLLKLDVDIANGGYWDFSKSGNTRTAFYINSGSAFDGTTVTYSSSDCTSN